MQAVATVYRQVAPDSPFNLSRRLTRPALDAYQPLFAKITDGIREAGGFSEPAGERRGCHRRDGRQLHDALHHRGGHRGANRAIT